MTRSEEFELSATQQGIWLSHELGEPGLFNVACAYRSDTQVDRAALARAIRTLEARHAMLTATFCLTDVGLRQCTDACAHVPLVVEEVPNGFALARAAAHAAAPFDLERDGPYSVAVIESESEHVVILTAHHIAVDEWSLGILSDELWNLYAAGTRRKGESALPDVASSYREYVAWEARWLRSGEAERRRERCAWRLQGAPRTVDLPSRSGHGDGGTAGSVVRLPIEPGTGARIRELARAHATTMFVLLLSAYLKALAGIASQNEMLVAVPAVNRVEPRFDRVVGLFANTLAVRLAAPDGRSDEELVSSVRDQVLEALEDQQLPYDHTVARLGVRRKGEAARLTNVAFGVESYGQLPVGIEWLPLELAPPARYDLTGIVEHGPDAMTAAFYYDADRFSAETVREWAGRFVHELGALGRRRVAA